VAGVKDTVIGKEKNTQGGDNMPNGDRTGPEGRGSKTGRGAGYCSGNKQPGNQSGLPGRGLGNRIRNGVRQFLGGRNQNVNRRTK